MSQITKQLRAVYIDGETKTGKGSASKAMATALAGAGLQVYYDVAGDFYRRFVALVRQNLELSEDDLLPTGSVLETAAAVIYNSRQAFEHDEALGDLQRPIISKSVSILGALMIAQKAGREWFAMSVQRASEQQADVIVLDGRNPRRRVQCELTKLTLSIPTALDLYMTCESAEAARRTLVGNGVVSPTPEQIQSEKSTVDKRRHSDRERAETPFIVPIAAIPFAPNAMTAAEALEQSWQTNADLELPLTITIDNTYVTKEVMLNAVSELATIAVLR